MIEKVVCVSRGGITEYLTIGKIYDVYAIGENGFKEVDKKYYVVRNDNGDKFAYNIWLFKTLVDIRDQKLEYLINN